MTALNIHILGICGTFMGGLAALARADGHQVSGSDLNVYPPMSDQLNALGIALHQGYEPAALQPHPDLVLIGNALSRGNAAVEYLLNERIPYTSGPRWLGEKYLRGRRVLAVTGTHGKTTTSSMLAWILDHAGLKPGFLIGGIPLNFGVSARAGDDLFVVEADEYDTSFFDKRAKFVHYRPEIAILNNLEFDHADIYPDLDAIQTQFHHLMRTIPGNGVVLRNGDDANLSALMERGCWSQQRVFGLAEQDNPDWRIELADASGRHLICHHRGQKAAEFQWALNGQHNAMNALAAIAAAAEVGVSPTQSAAALSEFAGVKRRLECLGEINGATVYDDFAHHPTAIRLTLEGLRRSIGGARLLVALEPASNTMRGSHHVQALGPALSAADHVWLKISGEIAWDPSQVLSHVGGDGRARADVDKMLADMRAAVKPGDHVVFMSNQGFADAPHRFVEGLD